jgi:hypothetical protein
MAYLTAPGINRRTIQGNQGYSFYSMTRFSLLRRVTAVLSSALLLQLSLLASGSLCRMQGDHGMSAQEMAAMTAVPGEHMSHGAAHGARTSNAVAVSDASSGVPSGACDTNGASKSCDAPWAPAGCASMATCVTAVSALDATMFSTPAMATVAVRVARSAAMPLGPTFAPELPPPRA